MRKLVLFALAVLTLTALATAARTPLDLMREGNYDEARRVLSTGSWSPRYTLLLYALTEGDAIRACSLYQVIAIRFPATDADSTARERLDQAAAMGIKVMPIAEWAIAAPEVAPLFSPTGPMRPLVQAAPAPAVQPVPEARPVPEAQSDLEPAPELATQAEPAPVEELEWTSPVSEADPVDTISTATPLQPAPVPTEPPVMRKVTVQDNTNVEPVDADDDPSPAPHDKPMPTAGSWFVQVGAFKNTANAHRLATKLEAAGFGTKLIPRSSPAGELLQVRVGGYGSRAEAEAVMPRLQSEFKLPTQAVRE